MKTAKHCAALALALVTGALASSSSAQTANSKIAFTSYRDGNPEIYVMNPDGTGQINLTANPASDGGPAWSPDGGKIAFTSNRDGVVDFYAMNSDGSNVRRLTTNAVPEGLSWSPDGTRIVFGSLQTGSKQIYVMNADGSGQVSLNSAGEEPAWSPDGTKIVFRRAGSFCCTLYTMNSDGSGQTQLIGIDAASADWSPDGARIAFSSHVPATSTSQIELINPDGSNRTQLTGAGNGAPSWSPDGRRIAFGSTRDGNSEIYVMNADGTGQTRLTTNSAEDSDPAWGSTQMRLCNTLSIGAALSSASMANRTFAWQSAWSAAVASGEIGVDVRRNLIMAENARHDSDGRWRVTRPFVVFPISGLPPGARVTKVSLRLTVDYRVGTNIDDAQTYLRVVPANPQDTSNLSLSDFGRVEFGTLYSDKVFFRDMTVGSELDIPLTGAIHASIANGAVLTLSLLNGHELENADHFPAPNVHNHSVVAFGPDTSARPRLEIEICSDPLVTIRVSQVEVCWPSRTNTTYQVQYRSSLTTNIWTDLGLPRTGTGSSDCILDGVLANARRFYRVVESP